MYGNKRVYRGILAVAFGIGTVVACCCSTRTMVLLLAIVVICLGLHCTKY